MERDGCTVQVEAAIAANSIAKEDGLLAAVSGGADSVALFHMLVGLRASGRIEKLFAAHVDHGIRETSTEDAAFVRTLCAAWDVPLFETRVDVPALCYSTGQTMEEAARTARYAFLRETKEACSAKWIVTAHHMDDQAETVLLHLLRGAGLSGLCGMRVVSGDIFRPLLDVSREALLSYIKENDLLYRTDESNLEPGCLRNRVRLELLPFLQQEFNPSIAEGLSRMAGLLLQDEEYLTLEAGKRLDEAVLMQGGYKRETLAALPAPIKTRAIRLALERERALYNMSHSRILRVCGLLTARTGARVALPNGMEARASYEALLIEHPRCDEAEAFETRFIWPGETKTPLGSYCAEFVDAMQLEEGFIAYMDADKLPLDAMVRRRMSGDRFHPLGAPGGRKLKEYLIDKKVLPAMRELPLIAFGRDVLFFPGGTIAHAVRVGADTRRIIRVVFSREQR